MSDKSKKGGKKSKVEKRASNKTYQSDIRKRRKESGLQDVTIYFDKRTMEKLENLCVDSGYRKPKKAKISTAALSNTIGALIRQAGKTKKFLSSNVMEDQELYKLRTIARYRKEEHNENYAKIVEFMETCGYPRPCVVTGTIDADEAGSWRKADIRTLAKLDELKELIKQGEEMRVRKNTVAMKKKKKLRTEKASQ